MGLGRHVAGGLWIFAVSIMIGGAQEPNKKMLDDRLEFTGSESLECADSDLVIGLFVSDDPLDRAARDLRRGAELAVEKAHAEGGCGGRTVRLVHRWADDPWSGGAREVVQMVFTDGAWAVIGGMDGDTAHVAQQVATKAHVPVISAVSSDPSLTHTRVPWIFRLPPSEDDQAEVLARRGLGGAEIRRVVMLTSTGHDGRITAAALRGAFERFEIELLGHIQAPPAADLESVVARALAFDPDAVVIRLEVNRMRRLFAAFEAAGSSVVVALPWIPGLDLRSFPPPSGLSVVAMAPYALTRTCGPQLKLERRFIRRWGARPTPAAAYGFDAVNLVVEACRRGASGRRDLRRQLAGLSGYVAATGIVAWDTGGGNAGTPIVVRYPRSKTGPYSRPPR